MELTENKISVKELFGEEYSDYDITIGEDWVTKLLRIKLVKGNDIKFRYYSVEDERVYSNIVDGTYSYSMLKEDITKFLGDEEFGKDVYDYSGWDDGSFNSLHDEIIVFSYEIDGKIRAFVGLTNLYVGLSYPIGFDLNKQEFIKFPINKFGLIDDEKMKEHLREEKLNIGYDPEEYRKIMNTTYDFSYLLRDLLKEDFIYNEYDTVDILLFKLAEYNYDTFLAIDRLVVDKINAKNKEKEAKQGRR